MRILSSKLSKFALVANGSYGNLFTPCFLPIVSYEHDLLLRSLVPPSLFCCTCVISHTRILVKAIRLKHRRRVRNLVNFHLWKRSGQSEDHEQFESTVSPRWPPYQAKIREQKVILQALKIQKLYNFSVSLTISFLTFHCIQNSEKALLHIHRKRANQ